MIASNINNIFTKNIEKIIHQLVALKKSIKKNIFDHISNS